uniref:Uncharacterized protein n=1 Tax=Candidatus Methanophaga sp. ANME-1 ERB7 TaxID=2759913 RepID=A0A7G9ZCY8_9EURY|nr:hypothetical protein HJJEBIEG_00024 [Methanosarcinales archaeon ANME-1 ERB7]
MLKFKEDIDSLARSKKKRVLEVNSALLKRPGQKHLFVDTLNQEKDSGGTYHQVWAGLAIKENLLKSSLIQIPIF